MDGQTALLEPDDLYGLPDGGDHYELIDGVPVEKKMGAEADRITVRLSSRLDAHCERTGCGLVFGGQTGYRCFPSKPRQLRKPDLSFVAAGRLPGGRVPKGDFNIPPDLAVEAVSPNDGYEEVADKIADFKDAKVRLIWVISPKTRTVLIRRADGTLAEIDETGTLSGEDVVPGFSCPVAELFV
ncbi:MAG: Uma2 family endonuclease [Gemmataceae bacterium]|nr:Uma2 family endonuclease [Gemmataceae bacterium]